MEKVTLFKIIATSGSLEDVVAGAFEAFLVGKNKVLVVFPSAPRVLRPELFQSCTQTQSRCGQCVNQEFEQRSINMNAIANDMTRQKRLFLVDFGDCELTNKHFSPNSRDG